MNTNICPKCNETFDQSKKFCGNCGVPLVIGNGDVETESSTLSPDTKTLENHLVVKSDKSNLYIGMAATVLIAAAVYFGHDYFNGKQHSKNDPPAAGKHTAAQKREKQEVTLFFSDDNERFLIPEKRLIPREKELEEQAKELVLALIIGSKTGLVNTFPEKAELKEVKKEGDEILSVNFRESLVENHPGGSAAEIATVYSLTNTLTTNLPTIKKVRILIGGKERESLKGHIGLRNPFMMNRELIAPAAPPKKDG